MIVLHLTTQDNGGAGRAAVRLHQALLEQGIDSQMIVQNKTTDLPSIHKISQTKIQKIFSMIRQALDLSPLIFYKHRTKDTFTSTFIPSNRILLKKIKEINPDIIHLHWIGSGFINIFDLQKFNKPILWSLHDANTYTGGCHVVDKGCEKYKNFCHTCSFLGSNNKYDLSYINFKRKQKAYKKLNLTINGLSHWITQEAKSSTLLTQKPIVNIPNTIDTRKFRPLNKRLARKLLGIETEKYILGFGAISGTTIKRKGYTQLKEALEILPNKHLYKLVVFGSSHGEEIAGIETVFLGHLHDDVTLRIMYSMLDIMVTPSLSESFGQVALESLACGTPVVCFNTTGLKDIVIHKYNGYLAQDFSTSDLANGIQWLLSLPDYKNKLIRNNAINTAKKFNYQTVTPQYLQQYSAILSATQKRIGGGGNKIYLGFGAISGTTIKRKGYTQLKEALEILPNKHLYKLVVFGSSHGEEIAGIETVFLGHLHDDITLTLLYNALDIFISPSLAENLSNTIMESLSCGTPVIAFDIGGNSDMIHHKTNGYLAKNTEDLCHGIKWCLQNLDQLSLQARIDILKKFDHHIVIKQYIGQYQKMQQ